MVVDGEPVVFRDPLAYALLGEHAEDLVGLHRAMGGHPVLGGLRAAVTVRGRYTEDRLAGAARRGVGQYVILGAGLDSYACRHPAGRVAVFEVDHPATQRWKREALARAGLAAPPCLTYVPLDMEAGSGEEPGPGPAGGGRGTGRDTGRDTGDGAGTGPGTLLARLAAHGFDPAAPALVSWLGVTAYLTREAVGRVLAGLGGLAPGSEIVVDHLLPGDLRGPRARAYAEALMPLVAAGGEPWLTCLGPREAAGLLEEHGFAVIEQVPERDAVDPALWARADALVSSEISVLTRARLIRARRRDSSPVRVGGAL